MVIYWLILALVLIIGAISGYKTLTNTFAVGFDVFIGGVAINSKLPITISARTGLAARKGKNLWWAKFINWLMRSPTHCEEAINYDMARCMTALNVLLDGVDIPEYTALQKRLNTYYLAR